MQLTSQVPPQSGLIQPMTLRYVAMEVANHLTVQCGGSSIYIGCSIPLLRCMSTGQRNIVENLWRELFADPSSWWDNRAEKVNARYPDFKHKRTEKPLWLNSKFKPSWVEADLAALAPGTIQVDLFTWNRRLLKYAKAGQNQKTIELFQQMQQEGMNPDKFTFVPVLYACSSLRSLEEGRRVHLQILKTDHEFDVYVGCCLVDMYANCGSIKDAEIVFNKMPTRDVVVWNAMILGHVKCGQGLKALDLLQQMQEERVDPNSVTFLGLLNACASVAALEQGRLLHEHIVRGGWEFDLYIGSSLVDMYAKCGSIGDAWTIFHNMPTRNVVSWNSMILGYVKYGQGQKALDLFRTMLGEGLEPNSVTFVGVLNACASVAALEEGQSVHQQVIQKDCESNVFVHSSLINMYVKCGSIWDAERVFRRLPTCNVVSWNAMLGGYAMHGHAVEAFEHYEQMCYKGIEMNGITFLSLLSACSHGGLVNDGLQYLESMSSAYNLAPTMDHYACVVDLLGRAGHLHRAEHLIETISGGLNASLWMSLLSACRVHRNVEMGERAAKRVLELDPKHAGAYVLLSNIYAAAHKWDSSAKVKGQMLESGVKASLGCTWIEMNSEVHSFTVDDREHPQIVEIHAELERLSGQMRETGYVADTMFVPALLCQTDWKEEVQFFPQQPQQPLKSWVSGSLEWISEVEKDPVIRLQGDFEMRSNSV